MPLDDERRPCQTDRQTSAATGRRPYAAPKLVEYGPVTKLTQNMSTGSIVDGNGMMMTCL